MTSKTATRAANRELKVYRLWLREAAKRIAVYERRLAVAMAAVVHGQPGTRTYENARSALHVRQATWRRRLESAIEWHMSTNHQIEWAEAEAEAADPEGMRDYTREKQGY